MIGSAPVCFRFLRLHEAGKKGGSGEGRGEEFEYVR